MIIGTLNRSYDIYLKLQETEQLNIMMAWDGEENKCMLAALKDENTIRQFIPFCTEQKENFPFDDFLDFFSKDGWLYLVFRYYEYPPLKACLGNKDTGLKERLHIGKSLLERMVLLHIPFYLQYEALREDNIRIDEGGMVYFNFHMKEPERLLRTDMKEVSQRVYSIFSMLFALEKKEKSCPVLERFLDEVKGNAYGGYMELYQAYEEIFKEVLSLCEVGEIKPGRLGFRVWERVKRLFGYLKLLLIIAVLASLFLYLIYTIRHPSYPDGDRVDFQKIGTLEIKDED